MAYTVIASLVDGDDLTEDFTLNAKAAVEELQIVLPEAAATWGSPVASGLTTTTGTIVARYARHGALVTCFFQFTFGASSAVTGDIVLTLPVTATFAGSVHGLATLTETGTAVFKGYVQGVSTTTAHIRTMNLAGTYPSAQVLSSTIPHTWANTDVIACAFTYLAA